MIGSAEHPLFNFGFPADFAAWVCLALAVLVALARKRLERLSPQTTLLLLALAAASLSWAYFEFYLSGGPRVIDATAYLLEARTFAQGAFSFEVPDPTASFRGRFLIHTAEDVHRLAPIFPPGYPALLSLAVRLGSFELLGPLLAAALVAVTYSLTLSLTGRRRDALVASTFSVLCACLRYHTAEPMSHGAATLFTALAAWASVEIIRIRAGSNKKWWTLLGLALGALLATRQLTGALVGFACLVSLAWNYRPKPLGSLRTSLPALALFAMMTLPGIILLLAHHHAITGDFFTSPQTRYYSLADGPADCFGLGLGKGCHYEHADVVAQQGGQGLTIFWALKNTLHRIHWHSLDVANFEPLFLIALFILWKTRRRAAYRPLHLIVLCLPLGYAFFYFNGSYPGGGARFFSELLPLWHALLAVGLRALRVTPWGFSAALLGFSLHSSFSHRVLSTAHFGPDTSHAQRIESELDRRELTRPPGTPHKNAPALIFFSSAHLFNTAALSSPSFTAARRTRDSREDFLVHSLSPSSSWIYESTPDGFTLVPWTSAVSPDDCTLSLETEFDYPLLNASRLWAHPEYASASCLSGRALRLQPTGKRPRLILETLPGDYRIDLVGLSSEGMCRTLPMGLHRGGLLELNLNQDVPLMSIASALPPAEPLTLTHIDRLLLTPADCPPAALPH